jgi:hypothetical protein
VGVGVGDADGLGDGEGVGDVDGVGDELVAAGTTLGVGVDGGVAALPHPVPSTAAKANTAILVEITACQPSVTPCGRAGAKGPCVTAILYCVRASG